jgi:hypothetical protein
MGYGQAHPSKVHGNASIPQSGILSSFALDLMELASSVSPISQADKHKSTDRGKCKPFPMLSCLRIEEFKRSQWLSETPHADTYITAFPWR